MRGTLRTLPQRSAGLSGRVAPGAHVRRTTAHSRSRAFRIRADDGGKATVDSSVWADQGFPSYMQSRVDNLEFCRTWAEEIALAEQQQSQAAADSSEMSGSPAGGRTFAVWQAIRREALREASQEPMLSSFLYASILAHETFERALAFVLANRLANATMLPTQLFEIFYEVLSGDEQVRQGALADVEACRERDPSCGSYSQALLYYKGFHAIQTHRIGHSLWHRGQRVMAIMLQSRISEVFAVDIHPAARIGCGVLLDHGTGVVIGETAVIGNNCSLLQNVTLGGTGKEVGDRHPKICDNVLIGASATILGNITIGKGAQIAAGSLVLKPVPKRTMVAGSPASPVGIVSGNPALQMEHWMNKFRGNEDLCAPEPPAASAAGEDAAPTASGDAALATAGAAAGGGAAPAAVEDALLVASGSGAAEAAVAVAAVAVPQQAQPAASSSAAAAAGVALSGDGAGVAGGATATPAGATSSSGQSEAAWSMREASEASPQLQAPEATTAASSVQPAAAPTSSRSSATSTAEQQPVASASTPAPPQQSKAPSPDLQNGKRPSNGAVKPASAPPKPRPPVKAPAYAADSSGWSFSIMEDPDYMI